MFRPFSGSGRPFCEVLLIDSRSFRAAAASMAAAQAAITAEPGGARYRRRCPGQTGGRRSPVIGRQQLDGPLRRIAWPITMMDDVERVTDLEDASNCFTALKRRRRANDR